MNVKEEWKMSEKQVKKKKKWKRSTKIILSIIAVIVIGITWLVLDSVFWLRSLEYPIGKDTVDTFEKNRFEIAGAPDMDSPEMDNNYVLFDHRKPVLDEVVLEHIVQTYEGDHSFYIVNKARNYAVINTEKHTLRVYKSLKDLSKKQQEEIKHGEITKY